MGEHKTAHPDAFALDTLCQNFLTAKRKLDEEEVRKIMESNHIINPSQNPGAGLAIDPNLDANIDPALRQAVAPIVNQAVGSTVNQAAGLKDNKAVDPIVNQGVGLNENKAAGPNDNLAKGLGGGTGTKPTALQAQSGGQNTPVTNSGVNIAGHSSNEKGIRPLDNGNNHANNGANLAGNGSDGNGIAPPDIDRDLYKGQLYLLSNTQGGGLIPHNCPPQLHHLYKLEAFDANQVLNARYDDFVRNGVNLCFVRASLESAFYFRLNHCAWTVYVPRLPTLYGVKSSIHRTLTQIGQMTNRYLGNVYCLIDNGEHGKIRIPLNNDDAVFENFSRSYWEQAQVFGGDPPLGAKMLPLLEVEFRPTVPVPVGYGPAFGGY